MVTNYDFRAGMGISLFWQNCPFSSLTPRSHLKRPNRWDDLTRSQFDKVPTAVFFPSESGASLRPHCEPPEFKTTLPLWPDTASQLSASVQGTLSLANEHETCRGDGLTNLNLTDGHWIFLRDLLTVPRFCSTHPPHPLPTRNWPGGLCTLHEILAQGVS